MRRFLSTPIGWVAFLFLECAVLVVLVRVLLRAFPDRSSMIYWVILGVAVVLTFANYAVRRRYLG